MVWWFIPAAVVGVVKGIKAHCDNKKAQEINERAQGVIDAARMELEEARDITQKSLETLGEKKLNICRNSLAEFVNVFGRIKSVELQESRGLKELEKFKIDQVNFGQLKEATSLASSMLGGTTAGVAGGAAIAYAAFGLVGTFGTASTGTAIASLGGAAATNATLAWLGGGSLAAGGAGVAGGMTVLGGLVAGPALAIMGCYLGAKASANLDNAYSNLAEAREAAEQVKVMISTCGGIVERAEMFGHLLDRLDKLLRPMLSHLNKVIQTEGEDYQQYAPKTKESLAALVATVQAMKAAIDTPLLNRDGAVTEESRTIGEEVDTFIFNSRSLPMKAGITAMNAGKNLLTLSENSIAAIKYAIVKVRDE